MRQSFGVAICRITNSEPYILLCQRRVTYEFNEFARGKYKITDVSKLEQLFNSMTSSEKIDIVSGSFDRVWTRLTLLDRNEDNALYKKYKASYEVFQSANVDRKFTRIIERSADGALVWEIPKGQQESRETGLATAMRETQEEAGVPRSDYEIRGKPIAFAITAYGITYNISYYVGIYTGTEPRLTFANKHRVEIEQVRWWSLAEVSACPVMVYKAPILEILARVQQKTNASVPIDELLARFRSL